jgi:PAS domain S-box-containing protein
MSPAALSPSTVLEALHTLAPTGTPVTTPEVAAEFDCTTRTVYNKLDTLVDEGRLETKKVGARGRVWWLPHGTAVTESEGSNPEPLVEPKHQSASTTARLAALFDHSPDMIDVLDSAGTILDANQRLCAALGYTKSELVGNGIWEYDTTIDRDGVGALLSELSVDTPRTFEAVYRRADGSTVPVEVNLVRLDIEGKDRFLAISRDITERSQQRELLEHRAQVLRQLHDITANHDKTFTEKIEALLALGRSELGTAFGSLSKIDGNEYTFEVVETDDDGIQAGDVVPTSATNCERVATDEQTLVLGDVARDAPDQTDRAGYTEWGISCYIGAPVFVDDEVYGTFCFYGDEPRDGQFSAWETTLVDLMSRWVSYELDRTEREQQYRRLTEQISDAYYAVDTDCNVTYWNDVIAEQTGIAADEIIGENLFDQLSELQGTVVEEQFEEALASQQQVSCEQYYEPLDYWMSLQIYPDEDGLAVITTDITDRKEREQQLELYETIVETVDDGIYAVDEASRFVMVNEGFCELTGYDRDELIGEHIRTVHQSRAARGAEKPSTDGRTVDSITLVEPSEPTGDHTHRPRHRVRSTDTMETNRSTAATTANRSTANIELGLRTKTGETVPCESRLAPFPLGDDEGRCGVIRDVSERLEREGELRDRIRQQEVVTELGETALAGFDLDELMAEAADLVAETLDNDYCKVLDLDADAEELLLRQGVGWDDGIVGSATVSSVEDDSQAAFTLATNEPVRVDDLDTESRFSGPALLTSHNVRSGISTIIGSDDDPWGILGTHDTEAKSFSQHDVNFVQLVANILATAINRHDHEQALVHQREQLAELNNINGVVHEITEAVIDQSTREEIEAIVCGCLAAADAYEFAWIAEVDAHSETLTPRAEAGVEGYLDDVRISVNAEDPAGHGPAGQAVRSEEMQVIQDVLDNPEFEPWQEYAESYGYQSAAAIPISYDGTLYGLLGIYANVPKAFDGDVGAVIARLGEIVGHAIAATERKQALMSPELTEIEFLVPDILADLGVDATTEGTINFEKTVAIGDNSFIEYGTVDEAAVETLHSLVEQLPQCEAVTVVDRDTSSQFELRLSEPPIVSAVASHGGSLTEARIENGDLQMTIHLPPTVAARRIIDLIRETYPTASLVTRRQVTRSETALTRIHETMTEELTERQRSALETAVYSGYFDSPRVASGGDIADSLGVSPPTFHQHLRKAQQKVFESVLASTPPI